MKYRIIKVPSKYISPINMNGLRGKMVFFPNRLSKNNILYIPDILSSLDLSWNIINLFHDYGNITAIDLPGIGGMEAFHLIKQKNRIDNFADYLASFIKLRYKNKKLIVVANGFGFIAITRTLQKYPILTKNIKIVVSINGISRYDALKLSYRKRAIIKLLAFTGDLSKLIFLSLFKNQLMDMNVYSNNKHRIYLENLTKTDNKYMHKKLIENDYRTNVSMLNEIIKVDNCNKRLDLHLWNLVLNDNCIDQKINEQHLRITYKKYNHSLSQINYYDLISNRTNSLNQLIPTKLKKHLISKH